MAFTQSAGGLLAVYLAGLLLLLAGLASLLIGILQGRALLMFVGAGLIVLGAVVVIRKIVARNEGP